MTTNTIHLISERYHNLAIRNAEVSETSFEGPISQLINTASKQAFFQIALSRNNCLPKKLSSTLLLAATTLIHPISRIIDTVIGTVIFPIDLVNYARGVYPTLQSMYASQCLSSLGFILRDIRLSFSYYQIDLPALLTEFRQEFQEINREIRENEAQIEQARLLQELGTIAFLDESRNISTRCLRRPQRSS
jgi:hypothetical protein